MNSKLTNRVIALEQKEIYSHAALDTPTYIGFLHWCELITGGFDDHNGFGISESDFVGMNFESIDYAFQWTVDLCNRYREVWIKKPIPPEDCRMSIHEAMRIYKDNLRRFDQGVPLLPIE